MPQKVPCNVSKGINSEIKTINATCSCIKCDSMFCFSKRHDIGSCSCEDCRESKTCLYYNNNIVGKESHSHTVMTSMTSATGDNVQSKHFTRNINSADAMTNTYDPWKYISGLCKNELGTPRSTSEPWKNICTSCTTDAMTNTCETSKNASGISKNVLGTPRSTSESWKNTCSLQENIKPNYKSEPNCDCEVPWNTIEQPDNKYANKANCDCDDPWNTIERPGNKYFPKKQYFCDCIDPPKKASKPKKNVGDPPGFILDLPKPEPANKPGTQMDTNRMKSKKCLPNSIDCNCKEPTTTLKVSINVLGTSNNKTETQKNSHVPQKNNNCNCKTSSKHMHESQKRTYDHEKHNHDPSNKKQKYSINRQETKTFEILNKTLQQKLFDCNDLLRNFNTSELPGYVLELPKHVKKNKLELCQNILQNQRNAIKTLNQMSLPQESSCNCNASHFSLSEPGYNVESQKHSHELAKKKHELRNDIFETQQNIIETLENKYLQQKNICICDGLSKNTSKKMGCMDELKNYNKPFATTTQKSCCNYDDSPKNKHEYNNELQKHKHEPSSKTPKNSCICDNSAKDTAVSADGSQKYNSPFNKTPKHSCNDSAKNTSESPGYIFELQKYDNKLSNKTQGKSCHCEGSAKETSESSKNTSESPGYIFELQKYKHKPSNKTLENGCHCDGSGKEKSESPGDTFALQKYSHEATKGPELLLNRIETKKNTSKSHEKSSVIPKCVGVQQYRDETCNKILPTGCNCYGSGKNISEPPGFIFELQKHRHEPSNKTQGNSCHCHGSAKETSDSSKNTSDSPGYIFELQKYKHKLSNKTQGNNCHCSRSAKETLDSSKNTSESPEQIFAIQKYSHEAAKGQEVLISRIETTTNTIKSSDKSSVIPKCVGVQQYRDETSNKILPTGCNCYGSGKNISEPPGFIFELQKNCHEPSNKTRNNGCNCNNSPKNTSESPGHTLFELQKCEHKPSNKTQGNNCHCGGSAKETSDSSKNTSESPGYIFELQKYDNKPSNKTQGTNCHCDGSAKEASESPGYIFDLQKYNQEPTKLQEFIINRLEIKRNIFESFYRTCKKNSRNYYSSTKRTSDPPGYIFELQKYTPDLTKRQEFIINRVETTRNTVDSLNENFQEDSCICDDLSYKPAGAPGYIFELQENTHEPLNKTQELLINTLEATTNTVESLNETYKKKSFECDDLLINISEPPGYILDLQKNTIEALDSTYEKKNCDCNKPLRKTSESPGYIYGLQKYKHEPSNNTQELKNILETQKMTIETLNNTYKKQSSEWDDLLINVSEPPGYIFDLQEHKEEPTDVNNVLEILNNTCQKKNCECNKPLRKTSESPGYIYGLQKYKHEPSNNTQELKNILESQKITIETLNNTYKKQSSEWDDLLINVSEPPGYIFDLQKQEPTDVNNILEVLNNTYQKKNCDCNKPLRKTFESPGYTYALQKYKHESSNNCNCNKSSRKTSKSAGYIFEIPKHTNELSNNTQELCKNIIDAQRNTIETLDNTYQKKNCSCKLARKTSESTEYISELQKYEHEPSTKTTELSKNTLETLKYSNKLKSCNCDDSSRKTSISSGYEFDLSKHTNELSHNTQELCKNILEAQRNTVETLNNTYQKKNCSCKQSTRKTSESSRYILELQKYGHDPYTKYQKKGCSCSKSPGKTSELPGHILELQKCKHEPSTKTTELSKNTLETQKYSNKLKSCNCDESSRKTSISSGYEFDLSKHTNELSNNTQELCKDILEAQRNIMEKLNNTFQKRSCSCKESLSKTSESSGYISQLQQYGHEPSIKYKKNSCSCKESPKKSSELPGYVLELQKYKHEPSTKTTELGKNTLETQKYSNKLKSCNCDESSRKTSISSGYVYELSKNIDENKKNKTETMNNTYLSQGITCSCNQEPTKKTQALKNGNLPSECTAVSDHNDEVTNSRKELSPGTAMLTAEVMNMPYTDLNNSLANKQTDTPKKVSKLSKYDIFRRIKEAYKACSCKVCECIAGKPTKHELCQCKPCECSKCLSYLNKLDSKSSTTRLDVDKFPCDQCKRDQSKRIVEGMAEWQTCDCKPCDCIQCVKNIAKLCDCEPCQCIDCKSMMIHKPRTLVVAPVGENIQRVACTCSPCDCIECGQGYPTASSLMHEMATGTNRHALCRCENCLNETCDQSGVDSCKCERRNRVMSKPVEKDTHDYDIRTATVVQNKLFQRSDKRGSKRHDTIAMFAAISNRYATFASNDSRFSKTKPCSCEECECIACVCKEDAFNAIKSSQLFSSKKTISDLIVRNKSKLNCPSNCKCKSCECQICDKSNHTSQKYKKSCVCDICDCINCEGETTSLKYSPNDLCICSSCECADCNATMSRDLHSFRSHRQCSVRRSERFFPDGSPPNSTLRTVKRGDVLTPSSHKTKVQSLMLGKSRFEVPTSSIQRVSSTKDFNFKTRDLSCYALSKHDYPENSKQLSEFTTHTNTSDLNDFERRYINTMKKCDAYMHCQERNKGKYLLKNNSVDNEIYGSYFSGYSSLETSCHKDYGSITPISRNKNKSWESSCNSSGHDYPEYLIQFPKSTVETCLKDVMELDIDKTIKLDKFNIIPKHHVNKITHDNVSGKEKVSQAHECDFIDPSNSKLLAAKQIEYKNQFKGRNHCSRANLHEYKQWEPNLLENDNCYTNNYELSNSLHSNLNKHYEHNEVTQTKQECVEESKSSIKINRCDNDEENHKYCHVAQNFNEVNVGHKKIDYISEQKTTNPLFPIQNEGYCTRRYSKQMPHSYYVCGVDILNIDDDYKRAQKTLKEAKEFSLELMRILEMYEKENEEFESITEKLKMTHNSLFCDNFFGRKEICCVHASILGKCVVKEERSNEVEPELQDIHLEVPSMREEIASTSVLHDRIFEECEKDTNMLFQKHGLTNLNNDIFNYENENNSLQNYDPSERVNTFLENNLLEQIEIHLDQNKMFNENEAQKEIIENHEEIIQNGLKTTYKLKKPEEKGSFNEIQDNQEIRKKDRMNNKNYKKYSKLLKRTIIISKRISIKNSNLSESNPVIKYCVNVATSTSFLSQTNTTGNDENSTLLPVTTSVKDTKEHSMKKYRKFELDQIMKKLDTVFGSIEEVSVSTSTDTYGLEKDANSIYQLENSAEINELEAVKPSPILKKNFTWSTTPCIKNKGVCIFPPLELQIKQAVQSISLQTTDPKKKLIVPHHENKALVKLQTEVKKLLDLPVLQPQIPVNCRAGCTKESLKSKLELKLKEKPEVSLQTTRKDVKYVDSKVQYNYSNEDLAAHIRELLNRSVWRTIRKMKLKSDDTIGATSRISSIGSRTSNCGCEALKVGFLGVRRVSDHTVLVKWNVPRVLTKVQGYELLVDGRAVQKIFSPSKSMAVVTCLPHTDKVLLTIRTITSSVSLTGHYPATTIIYRPRVK